MAFCKACGQEVGTATFCPKCGANQASAATPVAAPAATGAPATAGLEENVAGLLCYALGWVTGIIFLLIDKRPFVKFHAAQSVVLFGGLTILRIGLAMMGGIVGYGSMWGLSALLGLIGFVLWILLMVKAFQHQLFKLPVVGPIADGIASK